MSSPSPRALALASLAAFVIGTTSCVESGPPLPGEGDDAGRTVIYRDTWGVPHIYAPTVEEGLYAQGWTQAQDRPEQLLFNLLMAIGELSAVVGEDGVDVDLRSHLFDHYGTAKRGWESLSPEQQAHLRAFVAGMNDYYREHPGDVPWWKGREIDAYMVVAFGRFFLYNWSIDEAYGDLRRGGVDPGFEPELRASNQFAVAPSRSAEGAAILAIDPHLPWNGPSRFWEFRVHAGPWEGSGATLPGVPYIGLGHTRHLAWAMTTGGPDTADVYELTLSSGSGPPRYRFEGEWRELTSRPVTIEVRDAEPHEDTLWFSHHGPLIARQGNKAWAAKIAYQGVATTNDAWRELNFASDYTGALRATETLTLFPQNVMVADSSGNIYYQRTGRVPRRPDGPDWSRPVDGRTSATEWQGFHPSSDHLQVKNPPQGYMQNCNIPPDAMMPDSPFRLDATVDYIFSSRDHGPSRDGWTNQRGARAIELLSADESVTAEEAIAYINDVTVFGSDRWMEALRQADEAAGDRFAEHAHYEAGLEGLLSWDRRSTADSPGALKYDSWRAQLVSDHGREDARALAAAIDDWYAIVEQREPRPLELTADQLRMLTESFAGAMDAIVEHHGSLDAPYGDHHRVGRGEASWPLGGGGHAPGTSTLRAMGYEREEREGHSRWGRAGQSSTQVVVMSDPPRSWIYLPLGQSDREDSPHFTDQAEKLFSRRELKPSWWLPEDLAPHVESRTVLERKTTP
jgi:acyl-homoserine lactone acylase PvdQ